MPSRCLSLGRTATAAGRKMNFSRRRLPASTLQLFEYARSPSLTHTTSLLGLSLGGRHRHRSEHALPHLTKDDMMLVDLLDCRDIECLQVPLWTARTRTRTRARTGTRTHALSLSLTSTVSLSRVVRNSEVGDGSDAGRLQA